MQRVKFIGYLLSFAAFIGCFSLFLSGCRVQIVETYRQPVASVTQMQGDTSLSSDQLSEIKEIASRIDEQSQKDFNTAFSRWKDEWHSNSLTIISSNTNDAKKLDSYITLKAMGSKIIPLIINKLVEEDNFFALVLYDDLQQNDNEKITYRTAFDKEYFFEGELARAKRTVKLWLSSRHK